MCNGIRFLIKELRDNVIVATIITGHIKARIGF